MQKVLTYIRSKLTAAYIAKLALLTAIAFVLYMYVKFKLPFMFPAFLEMQFSELPALLAGFSMGPIAGTLVVIFKCLLKFPFSGTGFVGEIVDMIMGVCYVLPAAIIYQVRRTKKSAFIGLVVGSLSGTLMGVILNRFLAIPFYVEVMFGGNFEIIINMCKGIYPWVNRENFYATYLLVAVVPFNLLRYIVVSLITFLVYKRLSKILHWEIKKKKTTEEESVETSVVKADTTVEQQAENQREDQDTPPEEGQTEA